MALNYTDTAVLLAAYKEQKAPNTFLQNRYFPDGTVFTTSQVLVEYKDGNQKLAPFVSPEIGGKAVRRDGYKATAYEPAFIAPKRTLTIDNLTQTGFGEALYGEVTPEDRAVKITADDLTEMDEMIVRRHEQMCAQVLQENALTMNHYGDDNAANNDRCNHGISRRLLRYRHRQRSQPPLRPLNDCNNHRQGQSGRTLPDCFAER